MIPLCRYASQATQKYDFNVSQGIKNACKSEPNWGPANDEDKQGRYASDNKAYVDDEGATHLPTIAYSNGAASVDEKDLYLKEKL